MKFDNIFVSKGTGSGWTLNFDNPLSWLVLIAFFLIMAGILYPVFRKAYYYFKSR